MKGEAAPGFETLGRALRSSAVRRTTLMVNLSAHCRSNEDSYVYEQKHDERRDQALCARCQRIFLLLGYIDAGACYQRIYDDHDQHEDLHSVSAPVSSASSMASSMSFAVSLPSEAFMASQMAPSSLDRRPSRIWQ